MFVSTPLDVTDDGSTIIGYSHTGINVSVGEEAFIWDAVHGMRNLKQVLQDGLRIGPRRVDAVARQRNVGRRQRHRRRRIHRRRASRLGRGDS